MLKKGELDRLMEKFLYQEVTHLFSHLLFVNDNIIFCRISKTSFIAFMGILDTYVKASGQQINLNKSALLFSAKY